MRVGDVRIDPEGEGGGAVRHEVDPQDHERGERLPLAEEAHDEHGHEEAHVRGEEEEDELLDVAVDRAALADGLDDEGRVWYPRTKTGETDVSKRPQLKRYLNEQEGGVMGTVWTDIPPLNSQAQERLSYPME